MKNKTIERTRHSRPACARAMLRQAGSPLTTHDIAGNKRTSTPAGSTGSKIDSAQAHGFSYESKSSSHRHHFTTDDSLTIHD